LCGKASPGYQGTPFAVTGDVKDPGTISLKPLTIDNPKSSPTSVAKIAAMNV